MKLDHHLISDLSLFSEDIYSIKVIYSKKIYFAGLISKWNPVSHQLVISQRDAQAENKFHEVDFEKAKEIVIQLYDGKIKVHKDSKYV